MTVGAILVHYYGWRNTLYLAGAPGLLVVLILLLTVKEPRRLTLSRQQLHRLLVEGNKRFPAQPTAVISDDAIGEIAAGLENGKAKLEDLNRRAVHRAL